MEWQPRPRAAVLRRNRYIAQPNVSPPGNRHDYGEPVSHLVWDLGGTTGAMGSGEATTTGTFISIVPVT
jgi:hypothetical protein